MIRLTSSDRRCDVLHDRLGRGRRHRRGGRSAGIAPVVRAWLHLARRQPGRRVDPTEFGFGLGVVCGLFLGDGDRPLPGLSCSPFATPGWLPLGTAHTVSSPRTSLSSSGGLASPPDRVHQPLGLDEPGGVDLVPFPFGGDAMSRMARAISASDAPPRSKARISVSSRAKKQLRSLPSEVSRTRLQLMQNGRLTEAMRPTRPPPSTYS